MTNFEKTSQSDLKKISEYLAKRFDPQNTDFSKQNSRVYLCDNLIPSDIFVISGKGAVLQTNRGKLFDLASMSLNCILGQNDPWVNANINAYIVSGRPSFISTRVGSEIYYEMAEQIGKLSGIHNPVVDHRQCNGSDVTELAVLAAYQHRRKDQNFLISFRGSYFGQNLTSFIASDLQTQNRFLVEKDLPVCFLDTPDNFLEGSLDEVSAYDANILSELRKIAEKSFAVILEPIQVNNMANVSTPAFLRSVRQVCNEFNIPLIFDDIQTGFGWLGTFSSATFFNVYPDLMAVSKALTAGHGPLSALIMNSKYKDLPMSTVLKTNGADLRSLVAAKAVIERLNGVPEEYIPPDINEEFRNELRTGLLVSFKRKTDALSTILLSLKDKYRNIMGEIRGSGLIKCVEILNNERNVDSKMCSNLQQELLQHGVLVRAVKHGLLFKVPLVIQQEELEEAFTIIANVMEKFK